MSRVEPERTSKNQPKHNEALGVLICYVVQASRANDRYHKLEPNRDPPMPTPEDLIGLLISPNESLTVEHKSWLQLSQNSGRAKLAKAAIALANHGGGIIVLGMRPDNAEGGALDSQPRPNGLRRYSQDDVNAAINRFADPAFHCELMFANHPETDIEHAFVIVQGGLTVPVMSTRGCDGIIIARRCYIRKPGPRSEEPFTAEEWRGVLDRCVRAGREDMLDAIRLIVQGHAGGILEAGAGDALVEFTDDARRRWQELIDPLPADDTARMPFGYYELGFEILEVPPAPNLRELRRRMDEAGALRHTGWGPFVRIDREPLSPYAVDGMIESWLGVPEDNLARAPKHCDFWRAHPDGRLFLQRGLDEDGTDRWVAGANFSLTTPIWRVGEAVLFVARLARLFGENPSILVRCRYTGLRDRVLATFGGRYLLLDNRVCKDNEAALETLATATEIDGNLAEVLHPFLAPLYERFSFFELSMRMVVEELEKMRRGRF